MIIVFHSFLPLLPSKLCFQASSRNFLTAYLAIDFSRTMIVFLENTFTTSSFLFMGYRFISCYQRHYMDLLFDLVKVAVHQSSLYLTSKRKVDFGVRLSFAVVFFHFNLFITCLILLILLATHLFCSLLSDIFY